MSASLLRSRPLQALMDMTARDQKWLVLISPDPDALASALALKRILARRVESVVISAIFPISRPDNLAMVRYLRIPVRQWAPEARSWFDRYALVDSQPHHNTAFSGIQFDVVVDHHPLDLEHPVTAACTDIQPDMGATSTIFAGYLKSLGIRPGVRLATALQYGIRTDTAAFTRKLAAADIRTYQQLTKYSDTALLTRIMRSEYLLPWLKYFTRAFATLHLMGRGGFSFPGEVEAADLLVVIADFFSRVNGLEWIAVAGVCRDAIHLESGKVVIIFRGDGRNDMGAFAREKFGDLGTAGGHRMMARAEFPLENIEEGRQAEAFIFRRLSQHVPAGAARQKKNKEQHSAQ